MATSSPICATGSGAAIVSDYTLELERLLRDAEGRVVDATFGYGDELLVDVAHSNAAGRWLLGTQASEWQLQSRDGARVAGSTDDQGKRLKVVNRLVGGRLVKLSLRAHTLDLQAEFDGGLSLVVPGSVDPVEDLDDPPYWEVFSPGGIVLAAGPGAQWSVRPADAPTWAPVRSRPLPISHSTPKSRTGPGASSARRIP